MVPKDIDTLKSILKALIVHGAVASGEYDEGWLRAVGVLQSSNEEGWLVPTTRWIEAVLPTRDDLDLLRKTAIRDPRYRAHLDLCLCSVLHAVGKAERWSRFEELLLGLYRRFAPRFVQVVEWQESTLREKAPFLDEKIWQETDQLICGQFLNDFLNWDRALWGISGRSSELFPILGDLYLPLLAQPVHLDFRTQEVSIEARNLLLRLVSAAELGEGLSYSEIHDKVLKELLDLGLPIRTVGQKDHQSMLYLVGRVTITCETEIPLGTLSLSPLPHAMQEFVRRSSADVAQIDPLCQGLDLWQLIENPSGSRTVFFSISPEERSWPYQRPLGAPPWAEIPGMNALQEVGRRRAISHDADEALLELGNHPLYGFLLQVLLLESLDHELSEETLILAPLINRRVENIEAATQVLYRPRSPQEGATIKISNATYELGTLDEVLTVLAQSVGIRNMANPYFPGEMGPWSKALQLFLTADLITGLHDRWTLAPIVLDRLHGGGLMKAIIRRGHPLREHLHQELHDLWEQKQKQSLLTEAACG